MKNLQSKLVAIFSLILAAAITLFLLMGFATIGLAVIGVSFAILVCSAIYHAWYNRKYDVKPAASL